MSRTFEIHSSTAYRLTAGQPKPRIDSIPVGKYAYTCNREGEFLLKRRVSADKLHRYKGSATDKCMLELEGFWGAEELYAQYNLVHKRGILLHGIPGAGKSSTINLVTRASIEGGVQVLEADFASAGQIAGAINGFRHTNPDQKVLVIKEDIDEHCLDTGLLSLLDGAGTLPGVAYLFTTNYIDKLPPRLVNRPSRIDTLIEIGPPSGAERRFYFKHKLGMDPDDALVEATEGLPYSHLKEYVIGTRIMGQPHDEMLAKLRGMNEGTGAH